jgi:hypothetical protein
MIYQYALDYTILFIHVFIQAGPQSPHLRKEPRRSFVTEDIFSSIILDYDWLLSAGRTGESLFLFSNVYKQPMFPRSPRCKQEKAALKFIMHQSRLFLGLILAIEAASAHPRSWGPRKFTSLVSFGDSYTDQSRLNYFGSHNGSAPPVGWEQPDVGPRLPMNELR